MLQLEDLGKTYADGTEALRGVTLNFEAGEIVALVGGSGCGKSTLIRLVAGLDKASSGRILLDDCPVDRPSPRIGVVFQEPRLLPWLDVTGNIGFGLGGLARAERHRRIDQALEAIGLGGSAARWPRDLSGGQAQRVALARVLVRRPDVLLLDEPFSALDAITRATLQDHVLTLCRDAAPTLLIATHDVDEAVVLADRVVILRPHPGRVATIVTIDLPRPRQRRTAPFDATARLILDRLEAIEALAG